MLRGDGCPRHTGRAPEACSRPAWARVAAGPVPTSDTGPLQHRGGVPGTRPPRRAPPSGRHRGWKGEGRATPPPQEPVGPAPSRQARAPPPILGGVPAPPSPSLPPGPAPHAPAPPPPPGPSTGTPRAAAPRRAAAPPAPPAQPEGGARGRRRSYPAPRRCAARSTRSPDSGRGPFKWRRRSEPSARRSLGGGGGSAPLAVQSEGRFPIGRDGAWARETRLQAAAWETRSEVPSPGSAQQPGLRRASGKPGTDFRGGARRREKTARSPAQAEAAPRQGTGRCGGGGGRRGPEQWRRPPVPMQPPSNCGAGLPPHSPTPPSLTPSLPPRAARDPPLSRGARPGRAASTCAGGAARPGPGAATSTASPELERLPGAVSDSAAGRGFGGGTAPGRGCPARRPRPRFLSPTQAPPPPPMTAPPSRGSPPPGTPPPPSTRRPSRTLPPTPPRGSPQPGLVSPPRPNPLPEGAPPSQKGTIPPGAGEGSSTLLREPAVQGRGARRSREERPGTERGVYPAVRRGSVELRKTVCSPVWEAHPTPPRRLRARGHGGKPGGFIERYQTRSRGAPDGAGRRAGRPRHCRGRA